MPVLQSSEICLAPNTPHTDEWVPSHLCGCYSNSSLHCKKKTVEKSSTERAKAPHNSEEGEKTFFFSKFKAEVVQSTAKITMEILLSGSQGPWIYAVLGDAHGDGLSLHFSWKAGRNKLRMGFVWLGFLSAACIGIGIQAVQSANWLDKQETAITDSDF